MKVCTNYLENQDFIVPILAHCGKLIMPLLHVLYSMPEYGQLVHLKWIMKRDIGDFMILCCYLRIPFHPRQIAHSYFSLFWLQCMLFSILRFKTFNVLISYCQNESDHSMNHILFKWNGVRVKYMCEIDFAFHHMRSYHEIHLFTNAISLAPKVTHWTKFRMNNLQNTKWWISDNALKIASF